MQRPGKRAGVVAAAVALVAGAVLSGLITADRTPPDASEQSRAPAVAPAPVAAATTEPATTLAPSPVPDERCRGRARPFTPRTIEVPDVVGPASVVTPPRDERGVPGVPPLTTSGKTVFAWDTAQGTRPGDRAGNVLLNAHTWPDGSALGNRLLAGLHLGDRIVVRGGESRLCYRVTERVEVLAEERMPRYYAVDGPPQLAIIVCSGRRLGPGLWEKRTIWFAAPSV